MAMLVASTNETPVQRPKRVCRNKASGSAVWLCNSTMR